MRGISRRQVGGLILNFLLANYLGFTQLLPRAAAGTVEPGAVYTFHSYTSGHCLTANPHDFHMDAGVFLGQVSSDECEKGNKAQLWGVVLWRKDRNHVWLYPRKHGLNVLTAIPDPEEPLPEKHLVEIVPHDFAADAFLIKSVETKNCVLHRGPNNAITYEPCNQRVKEMLWTAKVTEEDVVVHTISDRSVLGTVKDFVKYTRKKFATSQDR